MKKYRLGIIISISVIIVGYFLNKEFNPFYKRIQWLEVEIPKHKPITKQDSLNGILIDFFHTRGCTYVTLNNGKKISIPASRNGLYRNNFIGDFLNKGDRLYKRQHSDTLIIERDSKYYYFLVGRIINE
jgi:hypothetical protein